MTRLFALLGLGGFLIASSPSFATERAICICIEGGNRVTAWFAHRPDFYGQLSGLVSVRVSGCIEQIQYSGLFDCTPLVGWHGGNLRPLGWNYEDNPHLGPVWLLSADIAP
jgi:hypothetical protein